MSTEAVSFRLVIPDSDAERAVALLEDDGCNVADQAAPYFENGQERAASYSSFEPLVVVVFVAAASQIVRTTCRLWREVAGKGSYLIIDARGESVAMRKVSHPEESSLVILTEDGKVTVQRPDELDPTWKVLVDALARKISGPTRDH